MHHYILETARLRLRPLAPGDAQAAFAWLGDPEVNRFMPYALYTSAEQAREWLESLAESDDPTLEFGFVRKSDGLLIGSGGIGPNEEGVWEVGYTRYGLDAVLEEKWSLWMGYSYVSLYTEDYTVSVAMYTAPDYNLGVSSVLDWLDEALSEAEAAA